MKKFKDLTKCSLKSLYEHGIIESINISSDFKLVYLRAKKVKIAKVVVSKKTVEALIKCEKLTDSIILKSSIVMLDQSLENRLRFYVNDYSDLGEIFERDSEQTEIIALELEKYWTISI